MSELSKLTNENAPLLIRKLQGETLKAIAEDGDRSASAIGKELRDAEKVATALYTRHVKENFTTRALGSTITPRLKPRFLEQIFVFFDEDDMEEVDEVEEEEVEPVMEVLDDEGETVFRVDPPNKILISPSIPMGGSTGASVFGTAEEILDQHLQQLRNGATDADLIRAFAFADAYHELGALSHRDHELWNMRFQTAK